MPEKSAPPEQKSARGNRRPRPGITHDNQFFWKGVENGELLIQRCASCHTLRHPPGPMCPSCRSLDWDTLKSSGRGTVYSYVRHYYPNIPPFEPGHPIAVIELEEGTRIVSDLVAVSYTHLTLPTIYSV